MAKPKEMHMADKLTDFVFRAKKRYDEGTMDADALKKIDEFIDVLSTKGRFGSVMVGLAKNVPSVGISKIVDYLMEKEPSLLLNLRDHDSFDYSVFEKVVIESKSLEEFHDRLNMFFGMSTELPPLVVREISDRVEVSVREMIARSSLNAGEVVTHDHLAIMENLYKRTACFTERHDAINMLMSAEELMLVTMSGMGKGVKDCFSKSFLKGIANWAWEKNEIFNDYSFKSLASKITVLGMNGDLEFANFLAEKYPEASQHARDHIEVDPSTYRYRDPASKGFDSVGFPNIGFKETSHDVIA